MAKVHKLTFLNVAILVTICISIFIEVLDINHQGLSLAVYAILAVNLLTSLFLYYKLTPTSILLKYQLLNAVKKNELLPYYQPIIDSKNNTICGYEVLIRWKKPDNKIIEPLDFIPESEQNGLITPITFQLISQVAKDIKSLQELNQGFSINRYFSINVSATTLEDDELIRYIKAVLEEYNIPGQYFALELTERTPIKNLENASRVCQELNAIGIKIKIDDIGMGYNDVTILQKLCATTIKVDKSFIDKIDKVEQKNLLECLVIFADRAEVEIIAEGIEDKSQAETLNSIGIHYHQGFLYGKPQPITSINMG
ncbi:TPA: EAL domain-containing protein [Photobacterium damselae]|uniref:EAL domain-containing protein n=1 Tax=Photobacterium damselae TaxID=38293 RepID=UPI00083AE6F7|nr:EAL domain-containing protein [Photobacterium damselae]KAB1181683.1 EAL domain-containing protein [Photobacterium damselae subsp. damselae]MBF7100211.1 EAL domain-containing protein [Photobacterium damselae]PSB89354.1 EAL domain-containing protein [Photobacterium damselae subsp. damselae]QSH58130.1 EAL domain-containing protein [Photobacterium damselae subsp. damselae]USR76483.1 EAL domain-containing protein [Photobacterium damselae]